LLRRGAPAGGKNFVPDKILDFFPDTEVIRLSSGSQLALVYYGDGDENALKHKIIYIAEAAILAERDGVESVQTILLRTLISEGRIDREITVPVPNGVPTTEHIRRNGPVALLMTTARDNVEEEMLTRLMMSDADESAEQTDRIIEAVLLDDEDDKELERETAPWLDFQQWLMLEAPYDVAIPFSRAILTAIRQARQKTKLRIRRDLHGFLTAVRTSAIIYKGQRGRDGKGRIIATLDDYGCAHDAFNPGLAALYEMRVPETMLAAIRVLEDLGANKDKAVKITKRDFMNALGLSSSKIAFERLRSAVERGLIERTDTSTSKTAPRSYKLLKTSVELAGGLDVFPSRQAVEEAENASEMTNPSQAEKKFVTDPLPSMSKNRGPRGPTDETSDETIDISNGCEIESWSPQQGTKEGQGDHQRGPREQAEPRWSPSLVPVGPPGPSLVPSKGTKETHIISGSAGTGPLGPPESDIDEHESEENFFRPEATSENLPESAKPPLEEILSSNTRAVVDFAQQNNLNLTIIGDRLAFDMPLWRKASPQMLSALYSCEPEIAAWLTGTLPQRRRIISLSGHARLSPQAWAALFGDKIASPPLDDAGWTYE
jgi:hypothetical protein